MHRWQNGNWLAVDVNASKDHGRLGDARQTGVQLIGGQMVQLQVNVILFRPAATKQNKRNYYQVFNKALGNFFSQFIKSITYRPSLISMVIERETTSRLAKSLATGAYLSMKRSPSAFIR